MSDQDNSRSSTAPVRRITKRDLLSTSLPKMMARNLQHDPFLNWLIGDFQDAPEEYEKYITFCLSQTFDFGANYTTDNLSHAALWVPDGQDMHAHPTMLYLGAMSTLTRRSSRLGGVIWMQLKLLQATVLVTLKPYYYLLLAGIDIEDCSGGEMEHISLHALHPGSM